MLRLIRDFGGQSVMSRFIEFGLCTALAWAVCAPSSAQEGFPLDGTWRGQWGAAGGNGTHVVIVMGWDGERIDGMINPGPRSIPFERAELEPSTWTVRIEAIDHDGQAIEIEGTLEDIGSYNRSITGSWKAGDDVAPFRITRE
jgi:hypothetical protein